MHEVLAVGAADVQDGLLVESVRLTDEADRAGWYEVVAEHTLRLVTWPRRPRTDEALNLLGRPHAAYDTTGQIIPRPESTGKRNQARSGMSEQHLSSEMDGVVRGAATEDVERAAILQTETAGKKKKKKGDRPLEDRRIHEAGGVIICDGKVVLRLTDKQRWIFPKGKVKKRESARDAATREATEETGLEVEVIDQVADLLIRHEGKKRRFVFYLMRATARTWDWPHHEGRDTFLITPERVSGLLHHKGYASVWEACEARVRMMLDDPTPFVAHPPGPDQGLNPASGSHAGETPRRGHPW